MRGWRLRGFLPAALRVGMAVAAVGVLAAMLLGGTGGSSFAYKKPPAAVTWDSSVPNYRGAATLHDGTIDLTNLAMADFRGRSDSLPDAEWGGDSGVGPGWDEGQYPPYDGRNSNGDSLDGLFVQIQSEGWWDLGFATDRIAVFTSQDHGPYPAEGLEYRVYGSNTLWSGPVSAQAVVTDIYLDGWRVHNDAEDKNRNGWLSDDVAALFKLPGSYQYVKLVPWGAYPFDDPEIDAVAAPAPLHYECYSIPPLPTIWPTVRLDTQFGPEHEAFVGSRESLCVPALKNGLGDLTAPDLKCYDLFGDDPPAVVNLADQFGGEWNVDVGRGIRLCQAVVKNPTPASLPPPPLHYECYSIPPHAQTRVLTLETQFGLEVVEVSSSESLCVPAVKNGLGDLMAPDLKCYEISGDDPPDVVTLWDQFGEDRNVDVGPAIRLCQVVAKTVLPVGGTTELLVGGSDSPRRAAEHGRPSPPYAALAGGLAAALALTAGAWYARRRWMR